MIVRTITAMCDAPDCRNVAGVRPDTSQVYLALTAMGWAIGRDGESTYCPNHLTYATRPERDPSLGE